MSSRATKSGAGRTGRITSESDRAARGRDNRNRRTSAQPGPTAAGAPGAGAGTPERRRNAAGPAREADPGTVARRIRDAVLAVPGVTGLTPGGGVEVATLFPGGKIAGIRLGDPVEVHVEVGPVAIAPVAEQIQAAVRGVLDTFGRDSAVEVVVEDIELPVPTGPVGGD
ncbi:hypothetical protein [Plantactinospora endophytica]|uniref:Asp23/Gls24 family envelope stress response protein n=1 Tax=Plantactinospora endophytica TaxID=673535 RepID=A0ABQ4E8U6_9ACTN|nr:hypothetical protein [Plantactinospora endophytica]GIG91147.1 hypothetical protein Pen02_60830 [Plantactinospora endophytica]